MVDTPRPEWLVEGADVVLFSVGAMPRQAHDVRRTTVARITATTFTVTAPNEPRFQIDGCRVRQGGTWGHVRNVVPLDSAPARAELARDHRERLELDALVAVERWARTRSDEDRSSAIKALRNIDTKEDS